MSWPQPSEDYIVKERSEDHVVICYNDTVTHAGVWQAENALVSSLPAFIMQLALILFLSRVLTYALRPLHQPRVVAEILAGVILGPSVLGADNVFSNRIYPLNSLLTLECVANYGLVYFMFLVGLEFDLTPVKRASAKVISIALSGLILPILVGVSLYHLVVKEARGEKQVGFQPSRNGPLFWGVGLAATNFSDLARILANIKLLHSEVGRTALSAAVISDVSSWILLVVIMAISNNGNYYDIVLTSFFVLISIFVLRPAMKWIIRRTVKDDNYSNFLICCILTSVVLCGVITDACGSHSIVGAFMWGAIMPKGVLKEIILEKIETFVSDFLMPVYFLSLGLRMNLESIVKEGNVVMVISVIAMASAAKVLSTFLVALLGNMAPREGLALGLLMNTKGLLALVILSTGRNVKALGNFTYSVMLIAFWVMTVLVGPILNWLYKSSRRSREHKCSRTIQSIKPEKEFKILACVHFPRNVSGLINILKASNATKQSPICVLAVHLVELVGRASAMLIVHGQSNSTSAQTKNQNDHIIGAFEEFESQSSSVSVYSLTAVSPYATMHDDICDLAEEKRVTLILLPFHKHITIDGAMEDDNPSVGSVNKNVFDKAPCSVALLVDRGLGATTLMEHPSRGGGRGSQHFAMFFIGGPDDREALAYIWRLSLHPSITVTVVRFLEGEAVKDMNDMDLPGDDTKGILNTIAEFEKEKAIDNEYMNEFKNEMASNASIDYMEKLVNNAEETLKAISSLDQEFDLYVVGRGRGMMSSLMAGMLDLSDYPELGPLGDALVSSSFSSNVSVLIMQCGDDSNEKGKSDATGHLSEQFGHMTWQPSVKKTTGYFEPFVNHRGAGQGGVEGNTNYF